MRNKHPKITFKNVIENLSIHHIISLYSFIVGHWTIPLLDCLLLKLLYDIQAILIINPHNCVRAHIYGRGAHIWHKKITAALRVAGLSLYPNTKGIPK